MTAISGSNNTQGSQSQLASSMAAGAANGADFNMFLKLLTTQMQNQDPLDPMDTSEYTQQLVQYSQVEQSVEQNKSLKEILARLSSQDMAQASAFIGREARFDSSESGLSATAPAAWAFTTVRPATSVVATITDSSGRVVEKADLDPKSGGDRVRWDGLKADGTHAPNGTYTLSITALDAAGSVIPATVQGVGIVQDVVIDGGAVTLGVNGIRRPISSLAGVAAAG